MYMYIGIYICIFLMRMSLCRGARAWKCMTLHRQAPAFMYIFLQNVPLCQYL